MSRGNIGQFCTKVLKSHFVRFQVLFILLWVWRNPNGRAPVSPGSGLGAGMEQRPLSIYAVYVALKVKGNGKSLSCVRLFATPWTIPYTRLLCPWDSPGKSTGVGCHFLLQYVAFSSVQFSRSVMSDSLQPHESQHARPPCPSPTPGVHTDSRPSSRWCHPAISSSVVPFSCPQSLPASESCPMSQLFAWGGQSPGVSALASFLPNKSQSWSPLEWTGWICLQSKGLSRVFSNTTETKLSCSRHWGWFVVIVVTVTKPSPSWLIKLGPETWILFQEQPLLENLNLRAQFWRKSSIAQKQIKEAKTNSSSLFPKGTIEVGSLILHLIDSTVFSVLLGWLMFPPSFRTGYWQLLQFDV